MNRHDTCQNQSTASWATHRTCTTKLVRRNLVIASCVRGNPRPLGTTFMFGISIAPSPGTVVWLQSLKSVHLNGQGAMVIADLNGKFAPVSSSRCTVKLLEKNSIVAVKLKNLSLSPSSKLYLKTPFCIRGAPGTGGVGLFANQDIAAGMSAAAHIPAIYLTHHVLMLTHTTGVHQL